MKRLITLLKQCHMAGSYLAQYWTRGLAGGPYWMPALLATTHWDGMPRLLSVARFTSLYSSAPVRRFYQLLPSINTAMQG